mmetsp:Transcript_9179/g.16526  ORF Transcript_9179/g.16526 Transcript_9179/m.16526 type:complete len:852 (-) Transcript_9179:99-2654(-)
MGVNGRAIVLILDISDLEKSYELIECALLYLRRRIYFGLSKDQIGLVLLHLNQSQNSQSIHGIKQVTIKHQIAPVDTSAAILETLVNLKQNAISKEGFFAEVSHRKRAKYARFLGDSQHENNSACTLSAVLCAAKLVVEKLDSVARLSGRIIVFSGSISTADIAPDVVFDSEYKLLKALVKCMRARNITMDAVVSEYDADQEERLDEAKITFDSYRPFDGIADEADALSSNQWKPRKQSGTASKSEILKDPFGDKSYRESLSKRLEERHQRQNQNNKIGIVVLRRLVHASNGSMYDTDSLLRNLREPAMRDRVDAFQKYKGVFEIVPGILQIPIVIQSYIRPPRTQTAQKLSWKATTKARKKVLAKSDRSVVSTVTGKALTPDQIHHGYRYGEAVVITKSHADAGLKLETSKEFKVLAFAPLDDIDTGLLLGPTDVVKAFPRCREALDTLLALEHALYVTRRAAIVRFVKSNNSPPQMVAIWAEKSYFDSKNLIQEPFLFMVAVPTAEDIRNYPFSSLSSNPVPEPLNSAVDSLIDSMALRTADAEQEENVYFNRAKINSLHPSQLFNPIHQRMSTVLYERALGDTILGSFSKRPEVPENCSDPKDPTALLRAAAVCEYEKLLFDPSCYLSTSAQTSAFKACERISTLLGNVNSTVKKSTLSENLSGNGSLGSFAEKTKPVQTPKLSQSNPIQDFEGLLLDQRENKSDAAVQALMDSICVSLTISIRNDRFELALKCLKAFRSAAISDPYLIPKFNEFLSSTLVSDGEHNVSKFRVGIESVFEANSSDEVRATFQLISISEDPYFGASSEKCEIFNARLLSYQSSSTQTHSTTSTLPLTLTNDPHDPFSKY